MQRSLTAACLLFASTLGAQTGTVRYFGWNCIVPIVRGHNLTVTGTPRIGDVIHIRYSPRAIDQLHWPNYGSYRPALHLGLTGWGPGQQKVPIGTGSYGGSGPFSLGTCDRRVAALFTLIPKVNISSKGQHVYADSIPIAIPNDRAFIGLRFYAQWWVNMNVTQVLWAPYYNYRALVSTRSAEITIGR